MHWPTQEANKYTGDDPGVDVKNLFLKVPTFTSFRLALLVIDPCGVFGSLIALCLDRTRKVD